MILEDDNDNDGGIKSDSLDEFIGIE